MRTGVAVLGLVVGCSSTAPRPPQAYVRQALVGVPAIDPALVRELTATGGWDRVIDPSVGVVELRAVSGENPGAPRQFWVIRRCGKAMASIGTLAAQIHDRETADPAWYPLRCGLVGTFVECRQEALMSADLDITFRFEYRSAGFMLAGVAVVDRAADDRQAQRGFQAELDKDERCPGYEHYPFTGAPVRPGS